MATYRLNQGKHVDGKNADGTQHVFERGALITTDKDLLKLNAIGGTPKFELLPEDGGPARRGARKGHASAEEAKAHAVAEGIAGHPVEDARDQRDVGHKTAAPGGQVSSGFQAAPPLGIEGGVGGVHNVAPETLGARAEREKEAELKEARGEKEEKGAAKGKGK